MGEKNCDVPMKNAAMGAKRPDSLPLSAAASKLWQKPPISPSLRRTRLAGPAPATSVAGGASAGSVGATPEQAPPPAPTLPRAKVTTCLQVTPSPATPGGGGGGGSPGHQRSFTSVNLTLRPPSSDPQPPIEITSANASLTYSTSSFDIQKGLESRLQITVSPTGGSVASFRRRRPHSCHLAASDEEATPAVVHRSWPDLSQPPSPTILRQQAKIDRLRIELTAERNKLTAMRQEVTRLEQQDNAANEDAVNAELEKQLLTEIKHLRGQCERLHIEVDQRVEQQQRDEEFYSNIYHGQRHPPDFGRPVGEHPPAAAAGGPSGGWSCPKCTFHNHPSMGKCEQCDMPYILHVSAAPGDNIHIHVTPRITRRIVHSWVI